MKPTRGFTLVELLLATVLTTVLMIGVMAVVVRIGAAAGPASNPQALDGVLDDTTVQDAVRLMRQDLGAATSIDESRLGEVAFCGFVALDGPSRQSTQRPARVVYSVSPVNGRNWLVRTQAPLDVSPPPLQRDLVCRGVSRLELVKSTSGTDARPPQLPTPGKTTWRLHIWTTDQAAPVFDGLVALEGAGQP